MELSPKVALEIALIAIRRAALNQAEACGTQAALDVIEARLKRADDMEREIESLKAPRPETETVP